MTKTTTTPRGARPTRKKLAASSTTTKRTTARSHAPSPTPRLRKISPLLVVDALDSSLAFWVDRLGFTKQVELPGFVILVKDNVEIMLETRAALREDIPALAKSGGSAALFVEVADIEAIDHALGNLPRALPRRRTFYGMDEIGVFDPAGHFVVFAQNVGATPAG